MTLVLILLAIGAAIIVVAGVRTSWNLDKMKTALVAFAASIGAAAMALWNAGVPS